MTELVRIRSEEQNARVSAATDVFLVTRFKRAALGFPTLFSVNGNLGLQLHRFPAQADEEDPGCWHLL